MRARTEGCERREVSWEDVSEAEKPWKRVV